MAMITFAVITRNSLSANYFGYRATNFENKV